jgi:hypothetical protein
MKYIDNSICLELVKLVGHTVPNLISLYQCRFKQIDESGFSTTMVNTTPGRCFCTGFKAQGEPWETGAVKSEGGASVNVVGCARFKAPSNRLGIELMKWIILCAVELFFHIGLFVFVAI